MSEQYDERLKCQNCGCYLKKEHSDLLRKVVPLMLSPIGFHFELNGKEFWCEDCFYKSERQRSPDPIIPE